MCYFIVVACILYFLHQRSTFKRFLKNVVVALQWLMKMLRQKWVADPDAHARKVRDVMNQMKENRCGLLLQGIVCWCFLNVLAHMVRIHLASVWGDDVDLDRLRSQLLDGLAFKEILTAAVVVMSPFSSAADTANVVHFVFVVSSICFQWFHSDLSQLHPSGRGQHSGSHLLCCISRQTW